MPIRDRLRVLEHWGMDRSRDARTFADADLVLTTYGTLRADAPFLKDRTFDCVILDEARESRRGGNRSRRCPAIPGRDPP